MHCLWSRANSGKGVAYYSPKNPEKSFFFFFQDNPLTLYANHFFRFPTGNAQFPGMAFILCLLTQVRRKS